MGRQKKERKKACSALFFFFFLLATTIIWLTVLWRDLRHRMLGLLIVLWQKRWCAVKQTAVSNRLWLVRDLYRSCMSSQCWCMFKVPVQFELKATLLQWILQQGGLCFGVQRALSVNMVWAWIHYDSPAVVGVASANNSCFFFFIGARYNKCKRLTCQFVECRHMCAQMHTHACMHAHTCTHTFTHTHHTHMHTHNSTYNRYDLVAV